jgi:hypothetical protein
MHRQTERQKIAQDRNVFLPRIFAKIGHVCRQVYPTRNHKKRCASQLRASRRRCKRWVCPSLVNPSPLTDEPRSSSSPGGRVPRPKKMSGLKARSQKWGLVQKRLATIAWPTLRRIPANDPSAAQLIDEAASRAVIPDACSSHERLSDENWIPRGSIRSGKKKSTSYHTYIDCAGLLANKEKPGCAGWGRQKNLAHVREGCLLASFFLLPSSMAPSPTKAQRRAPMSAQTKPPPHLASVFAAVCLERRCSSITLPPRIPGNPPER